MAIIAAATMEPSVVALRQQTSRRVSPLVLLGPLLSHALQFQQILSAATYLLFARTYLAARLFATALLLASRIIGLKTFLTSRFIALGITGWTRWLIWRLWDSKRSRRFKKKLELELYCLLLGPGGRALFLILFWPGWLLLSVVIRALWP
ncbi:hypothetical protein B0H66DRAFT_224565 [Apodospora peruviana]|uniref:Uncharacterized protein n=1 Tax=Apodospora peruviana TaxID=516989 RepID=A0AAE0I3S2_9PEZI|nr:hypothetical protein B0H66DRAFT_224565 [Apodospora peruviana]